MCLMICFTMEVRKVCWKLGSEKLATHSDSALMLEGTETLNSAVRGHTSTVLKSYQKNDIA